MLATFGETYKSLSDLEYGSKIITKKTSDVLWYWKKYILLFAGILLISGLAGLTYFTPQLAKLAKDKLPQFDLVVKDGLASSSVKQPQVFINSDSAFIVDLSGKPAGLDKYKAGVLVLADRMVFKDSERGIVNTKEIKWSDLGDFSVDKNLIIDNLAMHKVQILAVLITIYVLLALVALGVYVLFQIICMAIWSVVFLVIAKVLKKKLRYGQVFNLVVYASVIAYLVNVLNVFSANQLMSFISWGLFVFYTSAWMYKLK